MIVSVNLCFTKKLTLPSHIINKNSKILIDGNTRVCRLFNPLSLYHPSTSVVPLMQVSYQYQFVKTPFPRIWSNRDMSRFSFWLISPQFCIVESTKTSEKWSHMGEGLGRPLFHALGMFSRLFWAIFVNFLQ